MEGNADADVHESGRMQSRCHAERQTGILERNLESAAQRAESICWNWELNG